MKARLDSLKTGLTIICLHCEQKKPMAGAVKFRAHLVCAECAAKLRAKP